MAANAPYYQMRSGQFITTPNNANAVQPQFVTAEDEYDLSGPAAVASPLDHHLNPHLYAAHTARQTTDDHTMEENHNLVELLEAATAAGQAAEAMDLDSSVPESTQTQGRGKRKRVTHSPEDVSHHDQDPVYTKRRRVGELTDPQLQNGDRDSRGNSADSSVLPSSETLLNDARAAGVHSAAALFRRSSEKTARKYTRPPMSKLFISLQLSPESFLQLQSLAKSYMLDKSHPERQTCVGNRGKGDTDMVKLRLFNCVRDFLNNGVGEQFFGEHVEKPGKRDTIEAARALGEEKTPGIGDRLTWPRDGNKIISLVTPLMRRMVTNERQRQYAVETRKGGVKKKDEDSVEAADVHGNGVEQPLQPAYDPNLSHQLQHLSPTSPKNGVTTSSLPYTVRKQKGFADLKQKTDISTPVQSSLKLLTDNPIEPNLSRINIFLVLASCGSRPGTKLDEKRIAAEPRAHLAFYDYIDFTRDVNELLQRAQDKCPELKTTPACKEGEPGTENLRGLAAAANALQAEHVHREESNTTGEAWSTTSGTHPPSTEDPSSFLPTPTSAVTHNTMFNTKIAAVNNKPLHLPRYIIKSLGSKGWREIHTMDDWYSVLREKAFSVWADGVCNVLVELVDF
ncbi:hypothetical protein Ptr86124_009634 [Pyrenophora tritici-repentis]|uniref:Uncharacterized protein n=1 Tax=Pyrenophora tritici-repentis TaxID=45151 RepID=A0A922N9V5_9PLEO|nr:hypothetical protein Ptr86124_009634 [Pyrenophora tritici-repentis]